MAGGRTFGGENRRTSGGGKWTGGRRRRTDVEIVGAREAAAMAASLGRDFRIGRDSKRLTQAAVGERIGISHSRYGDLERGHGAGAPLGLWIAAGIAVGRPLAISATRSTNREPQDAGHLAAQELILRLAKINAIHATFELPTRAANPATWIDVGLRDDRRRVLSVIEVGNRVDDLGAARRAFKRHLSEASALAVVAGGSGAPYRVTGCWVLRATAANRELVSRYPAIFEADFPGSARAWARTLTQGAESPHQPGVAWVDVAGTRISEIRLRRAGPPPHRSYAVTAVALRIRQTASASHAS